MSKKKKTTKKRKTARKKPAPKKQPTPEKKTVLLSGDVIIDHNIYKGSRWDPGSRAKMGTSEQGVKGGARFLFDMLEAVQSKDKDAFDARFGLARKNIQAFPAHLHAYGIWESCPREPKSKERIWRLKEPLGYGMFGDEWESFQEAVKETADPDILVLDDGALGFRFHQARAAWPKAIREERTADTEWFVLKMANPLAEGDLWRAVMERYAKRSIAIVTINDIRCEEVMVTSGISWERTAQDLVSELLYNPALAKLLKCAHLIVPFSSEGALYMSRSGNGQREFRLVFDPQFMEGDTRESVEGSSFGFLSCLTAAVVSRIARLNRKDARSVRPVIEEGIKAGLSAMRKAHLLGHGSVKESAPGFPFAQIADEIFEPIGRFASANVPAPAKGRDNPGWTIMSQELGSAGELHLFGIARRVALLGPRAMEAVPYQRFGKLFTVDRNEIESLRNIRQLIRDYSKPGNKAEKPLSIAVFGQPGAGKSFGVKQIAKAVLGKDVPILEFNLSEFQKPDELCGAFHMVRDAVLGGSIPVVFWDEFDSKEYMWLQYLLAPMQDGKFREGQIIHPIGKCVFVFAGGTSYDFASFGPPRSKAKDFNKFKLLKGPDFISRMSGYLNVICPNQRQKFDSKTSAWKDDPSDTCYPVRRALLLRSMLGLFVNEVLPIDVGVLSALLEIGRYKHGARSLQNILTHLKSGAGADRIRRSDLPPAELLAMHVDHGEFTAIANRDVAFQAYTDQLAPAFHAYYEDPDRTRPLAAAEAERIFENLTPAGRDENRAAAVRMPNILGLVGLYLVPVREKGRTKSEEVVRTIEQNIELLAEAEHDGWMEYKLRTGWTYAAKRDNKKRRHHLLIPYKNLPYDEQEKDRNNVRHYKDIVKLANYRISTHPPKVPI